MFGFRNLQLSYKDICTFCTLTDDMHGNSWESGFLDPRLAQGFKTCKRQEMNFAKRHAEVEEVKGGSADALQPLAPSCVRGRD